VRETHHSLLPRLDRRRATVFGVLGLMCGLLYVGLTNIGWCMPAMHAALTFATALGTWWLAREDLALQGSGAVLRLVLTGVSLGLALTWGAAVVLALGDALGGAAWTQGDLNQVMRRFIEDTAFHWTPLGLIAALIGTGLSIAIDELSGTSAAREARR
jgi:hypothetical protein